MRAITMWDFSWLERRWPGAGYENWEVVLDEFLERGYDAVRIDAYPHLHAVDKHREWEILPCWNQQVWGSPARNRVVLQPNLTRFVSECAKRGIMVGLSSCYQDDSTHARLNIPTPEVHALQWAGVLNDLDEAGLLENILYVDLCNEWPFSCWAPFFNYSAEAGELAAAATGCWGAISTSNFCGPQFVGMWRDVAWHQRLTRAIHEAPYFSQEKTDSARVGGLSGMKIHYPAAMR